VSPSPSVRNARVPGTGNVLALLATASITGIQSVRRTAVAAGKAAALATAATLVLAGLAAPALAQGAEGCPGNTTLAAGFDWSASGWVSSGGATAISVAGDQALARWWTSGSPISAVVITAGTTTINYTYDPVSTEGAVAASDVESAAGAPLQHLGFCMGPGASPTSGSTISVGLSKTASCATLNEDQTATVQGTITVVRHRPTDPNAPSVRIRLRTTRDTIFAGDGSMLGETTSIAGLTGVVMEPGTDTLTVPYAVTFSPGTASAFSNKIEITIEEAAGLDRHKYYAAQAPFTLCQAATGKLEVVKDLNPASDPGKFNLQIDGSTAGTGAGVGDSGTTGEVTVEAGSHAVGETAAAGTDLADYTSSISCVDQANANASVEVAEGSVDVTAGADVLCTIVNTRQTGGVPTLLIEKAADVELISLSGPPNAQIASPSSVTWTLTYTLTNGPVTNAVITDPIPTGFTFVSASNGGTLGADGKTITWNLGTLSASGAVSFVTAVNVATISRSGPTVNVATIVSDQTAPDSGQDSVGVRVIAVPLAGNPTPTPKVPNTALAFGPGGQPTTVPIELLVALFLGSLGGLLFANVRAVQRRRR